MPSKMAPKNSSKKADSTISLAEERIIKRYAQTQLHISNSESFERKDNCLAEQLLDQADDMYGDYHDEEDHEVMWNMLNKSIACAFKDSRVLARAYRSRAELLAHLKLYEACLEDCQRGLRIKTSDPLLTSYFLYHTSLCYVALGRYAPRDERDWLIQQLRDLKMDEDMKNDYMRSMIGNLIKVSLFKNKEDSRADLGEPKEYPGFEPREDNSCVSKSIELVEDGAGRSRFVAAEDIEIGQVIFVEKKFKSYSYVRNPVPHCAHCSKLSLAPIACDGCSDVLYCSDQCRADDWDLCHQWSCDVFPTCLINMRQIIKFFFELVQEAGGIDNFASYYQKDLTNRGYPNQAPDQTKIKSYYNDSSAEKSTTHVSSEEIDYSCKIAYYLATRTNFLGQRYEKHARKTFKHQRVIYLAAAVLRSFSMCAQNSFSFSEYFENSMLSQCNGVAIRPLSLYFRHSCAPNAAYFTSKNHELVMLAKYPIKKGSKITVSYFSSSTFVDLPKHKRCYYIKKHFHFDCTCVACENNWDRFDLKTQKVLLRDRIEVMEDVARKFEPLMRVLRDINKCGTYFPSFSIGEIIKILKMFSEHSTTNTIEYEIFFKHLFLAYIMYFGNVAKRIPEDCANM